MGMSTKGVLVRAVWQRARGSRYEDFTQHVKANASRAQAGNNALRAWERLKALRLHIIAPATVTRDGPECSRATIGGMGGLRSDFVLALKHRAGADRERRGGHIPFNFCIPSDQHRPLTLDPPLDFAADHQPTA